MPVTFDKLLGDVLLHKHKSIDIDYTDGIVMVDSNGTEWLLTVNTDGALVTTLNNAPPVQGNPIGLLLTLTYSQDQ